MKYIFKLSGENYKLAKFELETLLSRKLIRPSKSKDLLGSSELCSDWKADTITVNLNLTRKQVVDLCHKAAMIQKCYFDDRKIWSAKQDKRFVLREPKKKIKTHPAMLKPKLARILINLTGAKKQLLDPFCGTGSILIEAGVLGLKPIGSDIEKKMIWYSQLNTKHFKIKAKLKQLDATQLETGYKLDSIESIACDPPYGKSSTLAGKKMEELYPNFLKSANKVLKTGGRVVMIKPHFLKLKISKDWKKLGSFDWYVHGGLTRQLLVLEKL